MIREDEQNETRHREDSRRPRENALANLEFGISIFFVGISI